MIEEPTEAIIETNHEDISKTCLSPLLNRRNHTVMVLRIRLTKLYLSYATFLY